MMAWDFETDEIIARQVLRGYSPSEDLWPSGHSPRRLAAVREKYAEYLEHEVGNQ